MPIHLLSLERNLKKNSITEGGGGVIFKARRHCKNFQVTPGAPSWGAVATRAAHTMHLHGTITTLNDMHQDIV